MSEREIVESCLNDVQEILHKLNPKKRWVVYYGKPAEQTDFVITDWNRQYLRIRDNDDYIYIFSLDDLALLYAVNVTCCSAKWIMHEIFTVIGDKF